MSAAIESAYQRIAAAMYAIDSHPGMAFLRSTDLAGRTLAVQRDVQEKVDALWAQFGALRTLLDEGADDPEVELDSAGMPVDGVVTGPTRRLRLSELAQRMAARCAEVTATLSDVEDSNTALATRLAPAADALAEVRRLAAELGVPGPVAGAAELERLGQQALSDPLDASLDGLHRTALEIGQERKRLAEVAQVRDEFPRRLQDITTALDELAAAEEQTVRSYRTALVKIAHPGLPAAPAAATGLCAKLPTVETGSWPKRAAQLAGLESDIKAAMRRTIELRQAADGLLDRRGELRGRLDAYRAKAARLGYAEHPDLSERHREAKELLYTSPCDLAAATRAVAGYVQSLAELTGGVR